MNATAQRFADLYGFSIKRQMRTKPLPGENRGGRPIRLDSYMRMRLDEANYNPDRDEWKEFTAWRREQGRLG